MATKIDCWRSMSREEFDRDHARGFRNGGALFPWCILTRKERIARVVVVVLTIPVILVSLVSVMAIIGMVIEGVAQHATELSRCQKRATTPYGYHQCK